MRISLLFILILLLQTFIVAQNNAPTLPDSLTATGNEPFWNLSVYKDSIIIFNRIDEETRVFNYSKPQYDSETSTFIYDLSDNFSGFKIYINNTACNDDMSGFLHSYSVKIEISELLKGCAQQVIERDVVYELHDIWLLIELNGERISNENKSVPVLELFPEQGEYGGKVGCNSIHGRFETDNNSIKFFPGAVTRMFCPNFKEQQYIDMLSKVESYKREELLLFFYNNNEVIAVFRKID